MSVETHLSTDEVNDLNQLCADWHEAGRPYFESHYPKSNYNEQCPKRWVEKTKYVYIDEGTSGAFILDKDTNDIFRLKSKYGVPNRKKRVGRLGEVTGEQLNKFRWY